MAQMIRSRINLFSFKVASRVVSQSFFAVENQRLCFHTSCILDVKGKELKMPSLSPTMESGTIIKWLKKEGDNIEAGDAIAEIQTDKAVMTMEFDDEGTMAKIIVPEGSKDIKVGQLIALTVEQGEDWKTVETPDGGSSTPPSSGPPKEAAAPSATASAAPPPTGQTNIAMPALSPTMTSGTIVKWLKKEGDEISPGDAVAEIQTDKAVMSFEMEEEGVLAKILSSDGSQVDVGRLIAIVVEKDMDWKNVVIPTVTDAVSAPASANPVKADSAPPKMAQSAPPSSQPPASGQVYGLAVKRLLEEYGISSGSIKGTGRTNRLLKGDVLNYIESNNIGKVDLRSAKTAPTKKSAETSRLLGPISSRPIKSIGPSSYKDIAVSNIRGVIAKRLGESKSKIPHSYAAIDICMDQLTELRNQLLSENIKVSVNDFIVKAAAHALQECPGVNTLHQNGQVIRSQNIDISVAVAAPTGLITPIVFDATSKSLSDISTNIKVLAGKAREGKLQPQEFQGGSFTISNLGMFGIREFSAIINPPQTAILAVGTGREILDASFNKTTKMTVTLSYNAAAIDEDQAAEFLSVFRSMLENPTFLAFGKTKALRHQRN